VSFLETLFNNKTDSFYFPNFKKKILQGAQKNLVKNIESDQILCIVDTSKDKSGSTGIAFTNNEMLFSSEIDEPVKINYTDITKIGVAKNSQMSKALRVNRQWEIDLTHCAQGTLTALLQSFKDMGSPAQTQSKPDERIDEKTQIIDMAALSDLFSPTPELFEKIKKEEVSRNYQRNKKEQKFFAETKKKEVTYQVSKMAMTIQHRFKPVMLFFIFSMISYLVYKYRFTLLSNDIIDFFPPPESFKSNVQDQIEVNKIRNKIQMEIKKRKKEKQDRQTKKVGGGKGLFFGQTEQF